MDTDEVQKMSGPALRQIELFLEEHDPAKVYGGLERTVTNDGTVLWLCRQHLKEYRANVINK